MAAGIATRRDKPDYYLSSFNPAFVRYKVAGGDEFDMTELPYSIYKDAPHLRYKVTPADSSKSVRYLYFRTTKKLYTQDVRFTKIVDTIIDLKEKKIVAFYTNYLYYWRTKRWFIFPSSRGQYCPNIPITLESDFLKKFMNHAMYQKTKNKTILDFH